MVPMAGEDVTQPERSLLALAPNLQIPAWFCFSKPIERIYSIDVFCCVPSSHVSTLNF